MKYLKSTEDVTPEYVEKLKLHIIANQQTFFDDANRAHSWSDFDFFKGTVSDRDHLCMPDEPMLIDRSMPFVVGGEHWYVICTVSAKNKVKQLYPVIKVDDLYRHFWRNGYFLLPTL